MEIGKIWLRDSVVIKKYIYPLFVTKDKQNHTSKKFQMVYSNIASFFNKLSDF